MAAVSIPSIWAIYRWSNAPSRWVMRLLWYRLIGMHSANAPPLLSIAHGCVNWRFRPAAVTYTLGFAVLNAPLRFLARDVTEIDLWINSCRYVPDERLFGEVDYWQTPDQTERNSMGDCEDFAIWAWVQLLRQGTRSRMVLGGLYSDDLNHAWVQIYARGAVGVLECTPTGYNQVIGSRHATEYRPVFSIDKNLRWYAHA